MALQNSYCHLARKILARFLTLGVLSGACFARIQPPSQVKVGNERYAIIVPKSPPWYLGSGHTDNAMRVIIVRPGQNLCDEQDTVIHEFLHAILGTEKSGDIQTVHDWIYDTSTPLIDLLRDNKALVDYLLQTREPCHSTGH